uniref:Uncharacterized protein n=1 Tax=Trypanosoma vivax (strain Y486) TaxID=1055687 RepID=G0UAI1_TRYVY|nr:hypothetical protein TVY486_1102980 [Trypanosoma vivax Y486]
MRHLGVGVAPSRAHRTTESHLLTLSPCSPPPPFHAVFFFFFKFLFLLCIHFLFNCLFHLLLRSSHLSVIDTVFSFPMPHPSSWSVRTKPRSIPSFPWQGDNCFKGHGGFCGGRRAS